MDRTSATTTLTVPGARASSAATGLCPTCKRTFEDCRCTGQAPDAAEQATRIRLHGMGVRL